MALPSVLNLTVTPNVVTSVANIRQAAAQNRETARNVVVSLEGLRYLNNNDDDNTNDNRRAGAHNDILTQDEIYLIFETLQECLPDMEELRLEWNMLASHFTAQPPLVPVGVLVRMLIDRPKLHTLSLYRLQLTGGALEYQDLSEAVARNTTLHTVRLEFCKIVGSPNLDNAVRTLSQLSNLKEIEVIGLPDYEARVCSSNSLQVLGGCANLRCIKLWGGMWQGPTDNAILALAEGLKTTKTLQDLEIGLFQLNKQSSQALADLLINNKSIHRIWLDSNSGIAKETVAPLASALRVNHHINNFSLVTTSDRDNRSTAKEDPQIKQLVVDMLKTNTTLRHCTVRIHNTTTTEEDTALLNQIDLFLKLNRVGRKRLLNSPNERERWLLTLTCERDRPCVTYYLLRRNPIFISQCVDTNPRKRQLDDNPLSSPPSAKRRRVVVTVTP